MSEPIPTHDDPSTAVREILYRAAELTPEQRQVYLDDACGQDTSLRREVESLLAALQGAHDLLADPTAPAVTQPAELREVPGTRIGRYKLLQQIGEGGFGVVFMAEQEHPVRRTVALKIIKLGMDTRQVIARFEAERQALAMMEHPNIARVFDAASTETGRPYFVMELVRGSPLTDYCDKHQLSMRHRLELFTQVCQAVQHAHGKGIIHRDLKPSNVLVTVSDDGRAVPKVIDFGIAKATEGQRLTDRTLFTEFRQLLGTPHYMSPEQAESDSMIDVDTRSDVYSLGVLLYELLTGTTPFDRQRLAKAACDEVRRIIRDEEPPRPSTRLSTLGEALATVSAQRQTDPKKLGPIVRGELDWIVMRALEKDRTRRYATANALARDVERYLSDQPVEACPPSRRYRLRKFARRNKPAIATAALITAVLLLATAVSAWQAVRATGAEHRARLERDQANAQRRRADEQTDIARAINAFLDKDVLSQASAYGQADTRTTSQPDPDLKVRDALDRAAARIGERFKGQPLVESAVREAIGTAYLHMGRYDAAEPQLATSVQLARAAAGPLHPQSLRSLAAQALLFFEQGRYADAEPRWREAVDGFARTQGQASSETISAMADLGLLYLKQGRLDEAEQTLLRAVETGRRALGEADPIVLDTTGNLADVYRLKQDFAKAEQTYLPLIELSRRVCGEKHPDTVISMFNLGIVYLDQGKYEQAEAMAKRVQRIDLETLGPQHPDSLRAMQFLATTYLFQHRNDLAEPLLLQALEGERKVLGDRHISTLNTEHDLARVYWGQGKHERALELMNQAYEGKRAALGDDHPSTLSTVRILASMYHQLKRYEQAEPLYRQALAVSIKRRGERDSDTSEIRRRLANLYYEQERFADAEPLYAQLVGMTDKELDLDPQPHAGFVARYGLCLFHLGRIDQAKIPLANAYHRLTEAKLENDPLTRDVAAALAQLYESIGRADETAKWRDEVAAWQTRAATRPASAPS